MKVTMKYDQGVRKEEVVILDIPEEELERMVELDYERRLAEVADGEVVEKRTVEDIFDELNKQEFNAWRRHHRYIDSSSTFYEEGEQAAVLDTVADKSQVEEYQRQEDYDEICQKIRQVLKREQADMIIAICLDGMVVSEYADKIGDDSNRVSKRFVYTKKLLKEILAKS